MRDQRPIGEGANTPGTETKDQVNAVQLSDASGKDPIRKQDKTKNSGTDQDYAAWTVAIRQPAYGSGTECSSNELQGESQRNRSSTGVELLHQRFEEHAEGINSDGYAPKESKRGRKHDPPAIRNLASIPLHRKCPKRLRLSARQSLIFEPHFRRRSSMME